VVERAAAQVAPVLVHQRRVVELHAAVDARDDDALTPVAVRAPHVRRLDVGDAPLHGVDRRLRRALRGLFQLVYAYRVDPQHVGARGQRVHKRLVTGHAEHVRDEVRLIRDLPLVQERLDGSLAAVGGGFQVQVDPLGLLGGRKGLGRAQVGAVA